MIEQYHNLHQQNKQIFETIAHNGHFDINLQ